MGFLKGFFSTTNEVNEDTVMGFLCFIAMCVAGFVPVIGMEVFFGFMSCMLLFFGKNISKDKMLMLKK